MSKLNKEFKSEVNQGFREADYVGRKVGVRILLVVLVIMALSAVTGVTYKKWRVDQDRKIFKQSASYNEGVLDDLAKYRYEMIKETDPVAQSAIAELVNSRFANFDESKIENSDLSKFLRDCRNGKYALSK